MADLEELIERVESGTGADRELDALICASIRYVPKPRYQYIAALRYDGLDDGSIEAFCVGDDGVERRVERFPSFVVTTSLDAVLALIDAKLPGWHGNVEVGRPLQDSTKVSAMMIGPTEDPDDCRQADAHSPARALLAATLRALKETQHADR